jgi:hypothetical protein
LENRARENGVRVLGRPAFGYIAGGTANTKKHQATTTKWQTNTKYRRLNEQNKRFGHRRTELLVCLYFGA